MQVKYRHLLLKGTVWALAGMFLKYFLSFFVTLMIARTYGVDSFGLYQYILSVFAIVEGASLVINYTMLQNDLIARRINIYLVLRLVRVISLSISGMVVLVFFLLAALTQFSDQTTNLLLLIHLALLFKFADAYIIGLNQSLRLAEVQKMDVLTVGLFNFMRISWVWTHGSLEGLVLLTVIQYAISAGLAYYLFQKLDVPRQYPAFKLGIAFQLIKKGFPLYIIAVLAVVQSRIVNILLPSMLTTSDLGLFSLASKVIDPLANVCLLLLATSQPILSHAFKNSSEDFLQKLSRVLSISIPPVGIVILFLALMPLETMFSLLSKDFSSVGTLLPILALGILSQLIAYISNITDALHEHFQFCLLRNMLSFTLLLTLSIVGIQFWGLPGVAWAVVIAPLSANLVLNSTAPHGRSVNSALMGSLRFGNIAAAYSDAVCSLRSRCEK